jgi:hypothetical protein
MIELNLQRYCQPLKWQRIELPHLSQAGFTQKHVDISLGEALLLYFLLDSRFPTESPWLRNRIPLGSENPIVSFYESLVQSELGDHIKWTMAVVRLGHNLLQRAERQYLPVFFNRQATCISHPSRHFLVWNTLEKQLNELFAHGKQIRRS